MLADMNESGAVLRVRMGGALPCGGGLRGGEMGGGGAKACGYGRFQIKREHKV